MAKLDLNRVEMPKQEPLVRAKNYDEVALGYSAEQALYEANRCIQCPKRSCVAGCPVSVDIPDFIKAVRDGNMPEAVKILKRTNSLPGMCGRVCPQETQCEAVCVIAKKGAPIAIGRLERYVADWELANKDAIKDTDKPAPPSGKRVAVVGSGPAGLTAAADLARMGHQVTIHEALHLAGGVLAYGIPEFRLPKDILQSEVDYVKSLGVEVRLDSVIGMTMSLDELLSAHGRLFGHTARGLVCSYETEYGQEGLFQQPAQLANLTGIYGLFGLKVRQVERERPDHISCELEFLEFLLKKQAYALEHGDESMEKETRKATRLFLKEHLGRFGRAFGAQMKKHDREGFMGKAGDLTLEFLTVECRRLDLEPGLMQLPLRSTAEDQVPMACGGGESDLVQLGS